jgi:O-antigen biosynthesis protein
MQTNATLAFTGERFVPEISGNIELEHIHRYIFALAYAKEKTILDIASGEGYGTALLASQAAFVTGVDIAEDAVAHARQKYRLPNLEFRVGTCSKIPLSNATVDLVVSFETIEHHDEHEQMLAEIKRVLKPDGMAVVSSPDKAIYTDKPDYHNPFHVKELYRDEFEALFRSHFKNVVGLGQKVMFGSGIIPCGERSQTAFTSVDMGGTTSNTGLVEATYNLVLASDAALPAAPASFLDVGIEGSETVNNWKAVAAQRDGDIQCLQGELADQGAQLAEKEARFAKLSARLSEQSAQTAEYLYHLNRINAWGWFRLGVFLDRLILAPLRLVGQQRSNLTANKCSDSIASARTDATSMVSDIAELLRENAFLQNELAKAQSHSRPYDAVATHPTHPIAGFDALTQPPWKLLLSNFAKSCRGMAHRLDLPIARLQGVLRLKCQPPVLFASDYLPLHDQQSGGLRQKAIIEILRDLGFPVLFASTRTKQAMPGVLSTDKARKHYETVLREAGVVEFAYGLEEISACLQRHGPLIRRAFISFPHVAKELFPLVRLQAPRASIFYDMVDLHSLRLRREADLTQDSYKHDEAQAMEATELGFARSADVVITVSDTEKQIILEKVPEAVVETVPNIFKSPEAAPPGPQGRKDILFLGGFWHTPNGDGVTWFVNEIWPKIRSWEPKVQFIIAGSYVNADIKALEQSPGVKVVGYVEDLKELFDTCRVFVAPLRYGAGMKGKVGHSLTYGLPLVSTSIGAEGIPIEPDEDFLLANTADEFAASVIRLLQNDELWRKFQRHGQDIMTAHFSPLTISSQIASLFDV